MRANEYPAPCCICRTDLREGEASVHRHGDRWILTHRTACPSTESSQASARVLTRRSVQILENPMSATRHIELAVSSLGRLVDTGWLDREKCILKILRSPATQRMDRLEIEEIIERWSEPARA